MPEQKTTGEGAADQVTNDQTGAGAADQTGDNAAAGQDEKMVPLASLEAERDKRQQAEQQLLAQQQHYQETMQMIQANKPQQQQQQQGFLGLTEEEIFEAQTDPKKFVEVFQKFGNTIVQSVQQHQFTNEHQDYAEVVGTVNPHTGLFEPAEPLRNVLKKDPSLQAALQNNPHAGRIAYRLALAEKELMNQAEKLRAAEEHASQQSANTQTAAMSTAAAGGGGAIEQAANYAGDPRNWTDEQRAEFERLDREILAGKHG